MNRPHQLGAAATHLDGWPPVRLDDLLTQQQLLDRFPNVISKSGASYLMRERDRLGLSPAFVKCGKRLLISRSRFEHWLESRAGAAA